MCCSDGSRYGSCGRESPTSKSVAGSCCDTHQFPAISIIVRFLIHRHLPARRCYDENSLFNLMPLRLYNTLSQQVEEFSPARDNTVRMYTCGPTVYDFAHIGNFRTFTFVDLLRRTLRANGFALQHVMNITDVDDKIIRNAVAEHQSLDDYTAHYKQAF